MKKRLICLFLCMGLMFMLPLQASASAFYRRVQYGLLQSYENLVYDYSISIYDRFTMISDEDLEYLWRHIEAAYEEGDDEVYDLRVWISPDYRYQFEVQVKEPTFDSFEEVVENAPRYLELWGSDYSPEQNVRQLHDGILRETSAGTMLETAISYDTADESGNSYTVVFLYYDYYGEQAEYCFSLSAYDGDYEAAQEMLDEICQTIHFGLSVPI